MVMLLMASAAFAQRTIELQVEIISPADGSTLNAGDNFVQQTLFTVIGPDSIAATDTLIMIDPFTSQSSQGYIYTGLTKVPGGDDTINLARNYQLTSASTGQGTYCVSAFVINASDPVIDSVYRHCNTLNYVGGGGTGVKFVVAEQTVNTVGKVFPNPANSMASFELSLGDKQAVSVKVVDLAGRVVLQEDKGNLSKGTHTISVNTSGIAPGLYLYQVSIGRSLETGKLYITR